MRRKQLLRRLRYSFDNSMARGPIAIIGWLAVASAILILVMALVVSLFGLAPEGVASADGHTDFVDIVWYSLMRTLDAGTMGGDSGGWPFLLVMLGVTLGGIFVISTLIGVLTSGIESRIEELRKGRSVVLESDHSLILGWSPQTFDILTELIVANENRNNPRIVILADRDKIEMEDALRARIPDTKNTRIICRTGNPLDLTDLEIVNPHTARSIIILESDSPFADAHAIKSILALTNNPNRKPSPYNIVAEIHDVKDLAAAKMVGGEEARLVVTGELISRIIVQTSRQSGLSVVYADLLDFDGDEIYFREEPRLIGRTFGDVLFAYEDSAVIGLRTVEGVRLNPPMTTRILPGDKIIAISRDDETVRPSPHALVAGDYVACLPIDHSSMRLPRYGYPRPERTLILGWNRRASSIVRSFDDYVTAGSTMHIVASVPSPLMLASLERELKDMILSAVQADTTDRAVLDELQIPTFDQVIVLPYADTLGIQEADASTLITLLHIRDISAKSQGDVRLVTEMLDLRNRQLAEVTQADDFIVSSRLTSLMLAQVSENPELTDVFEDLLNPEGSEIYLKPAEHYVVPGHPVVF